MRASLFVLWAFLVAAGLVPDRAFAQSIDDRDELGKKAQQLYEAGKYAEALDIQARLTHEIEKAETSDIGSPGPRTADALGSVAFYAVFARKFDDALATTERARVLAPDLLWLESNRAHALLFLGRIDEARALYLTHKGKQISQNDDIIWEDAIAEDFEALHAAGLDHAMSAEIIAALGLNTAVPRSEVDALTRLVGQLDAEGKYSEAVGSAERAVDLVRARYGEGNPKYAIAISSLAGIYYHLGRYAEAEPFYKRDLAISEKALGSNHADVSTSLNNLAELYRTQGRFSEAEPLYSRALAIAEAAMKPGDPELGVRLNNLAPLYRAQGRYAEAETMFKRALAITENGLGPDHPKVAIRLENLALLYRDHGRFTEAEPLYRRSLAIIEKAKGPDHPDVGIPLITLAELYRVQGNYPEAEALYTRTLTIFERALGPEHPWVGTSLFHLAAL
jgi:tetratricopeptide (TPR) repeat protein